jgi:hypothetical protein
MREIEVGMRIPLTIEELNELCLFWKQMLNLTHWNVDVKFCRFHEFDGANHLLGQCTHWKRFQRAEIKILDPMDWEGNTMADGDEEETLVHELLHLHFSMFFNPEMDTMEEIAMEQTINNIARALVALRRDNACGIEETETTYGDGGTSSGEGEEKEQGSSEDVR